MFHGPHQRLITVRPSFYIGKSDRVKPVIALAFKLLVEHEYLHDAVGYILGIYCMTVSTGRPVNVVAADHPESRGSQYA